MRTKWNGKRLGQVAGLVFAFAILVPNTVAATWHEKLLLGFNNTNGATPSSALIFDGAGNLYGATTYGGNLNCAGGLGCGVVFKLTPSPGGSWEGKYSAQFQHR